MKKKVLWIAPYAPYDRVAHAGGQTENYYIKGINKDEEIDVTLLSFAHQGEFSTIDEDLSRYHLKHILIENDIYKEWSLLQEIIENYNQYAGMTNDCFFNKIKTAIKEKIDFEPDVIIIEWTQFVLFIKKLKKIFPKAQIIAIEEDVSFLKYERLMHSERNIVKKISRFYKYRKQKKIEIKSLKLSDLVILNNKKDEKLVNDCGIDKTWQWSPYFNNRMFESNREHSNKLLFFGAMGRPDNYLSCIWFIENVFPFLDQKFQFVIVGSNPNPKLMEYQSERIIITGFVDDVKPYFDDALCVVAPLIMGAGIKIKVLEAMASGLTILTNHIGIEGIPAENWKSYIHCEVAEDYINAINKIATNYELNRNIGLEGRHNIMRSFDFEKDLVEFRKILKKL